MKTWYLLLQFFVNTKHSEKASFTNYTMRAACVCSLYGETPASVNTSGLEIACKEREITN